MCVWEGDMHSCLGRGDRACNWKVRPCSCRRGDRVLALINTTCVCVGMGDRVIAVINTTCVCVVKEDQVLALIIIVCSSM